MRITNGLLTDTLTLVQLARESALSKGKDDQAQRLSPVVDELKTLAATQRQPTVSPPTGMLAQNDFRTLLTAATNSSAQPPSTGAGLQGPDRNRMVLAMASTDMKEMDIARQLGMTLDEVHMVVTVNQKSRLGVEMKK
jgi:hypothetical protein